MGAKKPTSKTSGDKKVVPMTSRKEVSSVAKKPKQEPKPKPAEPRPAAKATNKKPGPEKAALKAVRGQTPLPAIGQIEAGSAPTGPGKKVKGAHTHLVFRADLGDKDKLKLFSQNQSSFLNWVGKVAKDFSDGICHLGYWDTFDIDTGSGSTRLAWAEVDFKDGEGKVVKAPKEKAFKPDKMLQSLAKAGALYKQNEGDVAMPTAPLIDDADARATVQNELANTTQNYIAAIAAGDHQDTLRHEGRMASLLASSGELSGAHDLIREILHEDKRPKKEKKPKAPKKAKGKITITKSGPVDEIEEELIF